jgi:hypothetical protein
LTSALGHSLSLAHLAASASLARWNGLSADAVLREDTAYPITTAYVPPWVDARERSRGGAGGEATLFLGRGVPAAERPKMPAASVPWSCFPGLMATVRERYHPAINGEVKSALSVGGRGGPQDV